MSYLFQTDEYFDRVTEYLLARERTTDASFSHPTIVGTHAEQIVRDFLAPLLATEIGVVAGQVVQQGSEVSGQLDVIVFDRVTNAILSTSASGDCLVHGRAVRAVIEVKRSTAFENAQKIQDHVRELQLSMMKLPRYRPTMFYGFVFRSPDKTLENLAQDLTDNLMSSGQGGIQALLVLDAGYSGRDIKSIYRTHINCSAKLTKTGRMRKDQTPTQEELKAFAVDVRKAHSGLVVWRGSAKSYVVSNDRSPLLAFFRLLQQHLNNFGPPGPISI